MAKRTDPAQCLRRYTWKLYPTAAKAAVLEHQGHMCIDLRNALLAMCECRYAAAGQRETRYYRDRKGRLRQIFVGRFLSFHCSDCARLTAEHGRQTLCAAHGLPSEYDIGYWLTELRRECPEWRRLSTWTPRRIAALFARAWKAFFNGGGHPRYKSHRGNLSIPHRFASGCALRKSDRHKTKWWLYLAGVSDEAVWRRGKGQGDILARGGTRHHGVGDMAAMIRKWTDADVRRINGQWEISVAVDIGPRRRSVGRGIPVTVKLGVIGGLALVNNEMVQPEGLMLVQRLDDERVRMQSDFDLRWPRGRRWSDEEWRERCEQKAEIGRLSTRIMRIRHNTLHVWSKRLVERASRLTIVKPTIREHTRSPRGDVHNWGGAVDTVSALNRDVLAHAPAMAAAMLQYKAREIGIPVDVIDDPRPEISIGSDLTDAVRQMRRDRRDIRKEMEHEKHKATVSRVPRQQGGGTDISAKGC